MERIYTEPSALRNTSKAIIAKQNNTSAFANKLNMQAKKLWLSFIFIGLIVVNASGQSSGDYRSAVTGNWSTLTSWQRYNGSNWLTPTSAQGYPGQFLNSKTVTIQSSNIITVDVAPPEKIGSSSLTVNSGGNLIVNNNLSITDKGAVIVNGSIEFNSSAVLSGGGSGTNAVPFTLSSGATLKTANANGITSTGSSGSIQVNSTRTYSAGAHYIYNGTSAQNTGTGYPTALTGSLTIDNAAGVTIAAAARTITNGTLNLVNGTFATNNGGNRLTLGAATINRSEGSLTGTLSGGNYDVIYTGDSKTTGQELSGTLNNVRINLTSDQILILNQDKTLAGNLSVTSGIFNLSIYTINRLTSGGALSVSSGAILKIGGTTNFPSNYSSNTLNATSTVEYYLGGDQTVSAKTYGNLVFSGSGNKTVAALTSVVGNLSIAGAKANLATGISVSVNSLTLGGFNKIDGTWGSTSSNASFKDDNYFTATTGIVTVTIDTRPIPTFSSLTSSQNICFGTSTVTLSGIVSATGPIYPENTEKVGVSINGTTVNVTLNSVGVFSIDYNSSSIPASVTPYTITYSYGGGANLKPAVNNTSTTLSVTPTSLEWNGSVSNSWENANNWTPAYVPISCTDVIIPDITNSPTITLSAACHNITIQSGASLVDKKPGEAPGYLAISGTATFNHTFDNSASTWDWHNLSSPVSSQAIWPNFAPNPPQGTDYLTYKWATGAKWDFYYFNPNCPADEKVWVNLRLEDNGGFNFYNYRPVDEGTSFAGFGTTVPPTMKNGRGYLVAYDNSYGLDRTFTGTLNTGDIAVSSTNTVATFNLVGNPYPSHLDWSLSGGFNRSNLENLGTSEVPVYAYWVYNHDAGNYGAFASDGNVYSETGVATNGTSRYIAPAQGFFVKAKDLSSTARTLIGFTNGARTHSSQAWLKTSQTGSNQIRLKLTSNSVTYSDEMLISFSENYSGTNGVDKFPSMNSDAPEIYSVKNGKNYSIDMLRETEESSIVYISTKCGMEGDYTISANNLTDFILSNKVRLEDLKTGIVTDLKEKSSYSFSGSPTDELNRFRLIIGSPIGIDEPNTNGSFNIYTYENMVYVQNDKTNEPYFVTVSNMLGQTLVRTDFTGNSLNRIEMQNVPGVYVVNVVSNGKTYSQKVVIR